MKFHIVLANLKETQEQTREEILLINSEILAANSYAEKIKLKIDLDEKLNAVYSGTVQNHLEGVYNTANEKNTFWIAASGLLYVVGSLIILTLLIIRTILVFRN